MEAKRLVFAQMLVSGQTAGGQDLVLIKKRNDVAINTVMKSIEMKAAMMTLSTPATSDDRDGNHDDDRYNDNDNSNDNISSTTTTTTPRIQRNAILYGASHCQDLQSKLFKMGYSLSKVTYSRAFKVDVPKFGTGRVQFISNNNGRNTGINSGGGGGGDFRKRQSREQENSSSSSTTATSITSWRDFVATSDPSSIGVGLVLVPLYLLIGGMDWLATIRDISISLDEGSLLDASAIGLFYLVRHVALYLGLAKFVVDWDGDKSLFGR